MFAYINRKNGLNLCAMKNGENINTDVCIYQNLKTVRSLG